MAMVLLFLGRALSFSLLSLLFVGSSALAQSFVRLNSEHRLEVPLSYEKLLGRLEGEDASRSMFLSQQVQLIEYLPRKETSVEPSHDSNVADRSSSQAHEPKVNRAVIDILGQSCEFGWMRYVMSISAGEERTSIAVDLVQPAGMLVGQSYQFQIQPIDDHHCSVQISHRLDVKLIQRRLDLVNSIIRQVTCKEASRQIGILTRAMAHCLLEIATQPPSKSKAPATDKKPEKKAESTKSEPAKPDVLDDSDSQSSAPRLRIKIRVAETGKGAIRVAFFRPRINSADSMRERRKRNKVKPIESRSLKSKAIPSWCANSEMSNQENM